MWLIIFAIPLLPLACVINLITNNTSYEEHYRRAEIARSEYQNNIEKELVISNVKITGGTVNYTLTNLSNTVFTGAQVGFCWGEDLDHRFRSPTNHCDYQNLHQEMEYGFPPNESKEFSNYLSSGEAIYVPITNLDIWIKDIEYIDDCRKKSNWNADHKCNYIHGVEYL
tara:strand:- start:172 stop:678 length:507 start_codon:yes stop_codon:yes gene_type:complete